MPGLREVLERLDAGDAVRGGAIVGADGLIIHNALQRDADEDAIAALAVTTMRHAEQLGSSSGSGQLRTAVLEYGGGPAILAPLSSAATLVVLTKPDRDLGPLLYALRTERDALSGLV
jgi:predicted regulator of Ras-like GTPase activity (Roadblock/LC7/MglB family)